MPRWSSQSAYRDTIVNSWAWCMTCNVTPAGTTTHISHRSITVWPWVAVPESDRRSGSPACVSVALRNHYAYCNIIPTWRLTSIQQVPTSCLMVVTLLAMFKETMEYHHHISPPFRIHWGDCGENATTDCRKIHVPSTQNSLIWFTDEGWYVAYAWSDTYIRFVRLLQHDA